jgi:cob(I)alamin adenosyltransferase
VSARKKTTTASGAVIPEGREHPGRPKRKVPVEVGTPPREKRAGLVILNTGNGKGKTTAALGVLFRAAGRGLRTCMLQFIKSKGAQHGEHIAAERFGIEIVPLGEGFTWLGEDAERDRALAQECWALCRERLLSGEYDVVAFDELTYALKYGWLTHEEVLGTIRQRAVGTHVIITGRYASDELKQFADLVSEIENVKHPRQRGVALQPGIDL